jgi:hypothetical protein
MYFLREAGPGETARRIKSRFQDGEASPSVRQRTEGRDKELPNELG